MSKKKEAKKFDVWVKRDHIFSVTIETDTLEQALEIAKQMSIDDLLDAPGEQIESEHKFTAVMEA